MKTVFGSFRDLRGNLLPIEFTDLPFHPKRVFVVSNVPKGTIRGDHAHKTNIQFLICLKGKIEVTLYSLTLGYSEMVVLKEGEGVLVDKMIWSRQKFLVDNSELLVFASEPYDKDDYIDNFSEYLSL